MIRSMLNWRSLLALLAIIIVSGTIFYSQYLAKKIAGEERQKVEEWVAASKAILNATDLTLPNLIRNGQQSIPIIETNENDSIMGYINLDSLKAVTDQHYLEHELKKFRSENQPFEIKFSDKPYIANRYYYGHTVLLDEVRYYPLVQLCIVAFFIFFALYSITIRNKATQNQLWAGMAKETAHQLGTPVSSLEGWVEMLRESGTDARMLQEIQKDVDRLKLVSDRFGKIGSKPQLEEKDVVLQVQQMVDYIKRRATGKVQFSLQVVNPALPAGHPSSGDQPSGDQPSGDQPSGDQPSGSNKPKPGVVTSGNPGKIPALISGPLFDWVIENLLKNALDAIEGKGDIRVTIQQSEKEIVVDVADTGKGIAKQNLQKVFKPGFTTKKRGWGLGLSLSKRIIEQYHQGQLSVRQSEQGKGTTFRIVLKK